MIDNFRPGVVKRLGIDYETLTRDNEDLIYCSISGSRARIVPPEKPPLDPQR